MSRSVGVDPAPLPADDVEPVERLLDVAARPDGRQQAALSRPVSRMCRPLRVAGEDDRGVVARGVAGVDVAQGPVVVAADAEVLDRARGVPLVPLQAGQAGVEQADVDPAGHGVGIAARRGSRSRRPREALAVDRDAEVVEPDRLGPRVAQHADVLGQAEGAGHLVGGVVVAGDDEDRDVRVPQPAELPTRWRPVL